ncbi:hypothetical protein K450DRAFT_176453 [Umbelopsis ramanniana AG]|uniref:Uncharacterized protein n=1 Tax=Umbelopsis ramanniana AG TaxID=1314678 RepID=A0AAD5E6J4_UMBRA|nr:uncharacterized protein K450DRAFT_176453 [Umbelopsis ramanniana AG]KAI8578316.1 hypothetical protein K450DRAFT_176453 [Umbelopsis ramanniana AG]
MPTNTSAKLNGKVAIVTGSSRGLGATIATHLASQGAQVVVNFVNSAEKANLVVSAIKDNCGEAIAVKANIGTEDGPQKLVDETVKAFGHIDIIVNNSAILKVEELGEIMTANFDDSYAINVRGPLLLVQASLPYLRDNGRIINISSTSARAGYPGLSVYGGTKGAIEAMSRVWASELGPKRNITSNCVGAGPIMTDMINDDVEWAKGMTVNAPLPRIASPADIADIVGFLASEQSHWVTGDVINANGGIIFY